MREHSNVVKFVGDLKFDAEIKRTQNNLAYCNFVLGAQRQTQQGPRTDNASFVAFADSCKKLEGAKKGDEVTVTGRLSTSSHEKDGKKIYQMKVIADSVEVFKFARSDEPDPMGEPSLDDIPF